MIEIVVKGENISFKCNRSGLCEVSTTVGKHDNRYMVDFAKCILEMCGAV